MVGTHYSKFGRGVHMVIEIPWPSEIPSSRWNHVETVFGHDSVRAWRGGRRYGVNLFGLFPNSLGAGRFGHAGCESNQNDACFMSTFIFNLDLPTLARGCDLI